MNPFLEGYSIWPKIVIIFNVPYSTSKVKNTWDRFRNVLGKNWLYFVLQVIVLTCLTLKQHSKTRKLRFWHIRRRHRQHPFPRLDGAVERTEDFFSVSLLPFSLFQLQLILWLCYCMKKSFNPVQIGKIS